VRALFAHLGSESDGGAAFIAHTFARPNRILPRGAQLRVQSVLIADPAGGGHAATAPPPYEAP
jgi:hypothetical protein